MFLAADVATSIYNLPLRLPCCIVLDGMKKQILFYITLLAIGALLVVFQFVNPSSAGPLGVLFVFLCMYVIAFGISTYAVYGLSKLAPRLSRMIALRKPLPSISLRKSHYYGSVLALGFVMIVAVQSVGSLDIYTVGLILLFVAIGCAYVSRQAH